MTRRVAVLASLMFLPWTTLHASIGPSLEAVLAACPPDSALSVIVVLKDRVDLEGLKGSFDIAHEGFAGRHLRTMQALKRKASASQAGVLALLTRGVEDGGVIDLHPFWIVNAVRVKAVPRMIVRCAAKDDVERVVLDEQIRLPVPVAGLPLPPSPQGFEPNLGVIGADSLWRLGYTGKGVLVCSLDSGVDVDHPSLSSKWRGAKGFPNSECWFDPYNQSSRPVDDDLLGNTTHGTGVMSVIVGSSGSDTVGVAPGATWIAANAFEADSRGSEITTNGVLLECFEWAADPDGDPATVADVPRIINNSWGTNLTNGGGACEDVLYDAIDAVETMGAAVMFSVGNTGTYGAFSTASPASRVASPVNAFSVGSISNSLVISSFSSRGPSTCDSSSIKPEVVAPGSNIRMARGLAAGGGYHVLSGTSFSTPHVAGGAALLLDVNPLLTGDEVKYALLNSAADLGFPGEDNDYGMGVVDLPAALALVGTPGTSSIAIATIDYEDYGDHAPDPGETVDVVLGLRNGGTAVSDLQTALSCADPLVSILQAGANYGDLGVRQTVDNRGAPFVVTFDHSITDGETVTFRLALSWAEGEADTLRFDAVVGAAPVGGVGDHDIGNVRFTITNFGQYGYFNGAKSVGNGFQFPKDGTNWLFHGAFLAATNPLQVSDGADGGENDWRVIPGGNLSFTTSGDVADQEGYAAFDDSGAEHPLPVRVLQRSFAYSDNFNGDYVILVYFVINPDPARTLTNLYTGLYFDWDLDSVWYNRNYVDWYADSTGSFGYMWGDQFQTYVGLSLLSHTATSYRAIDNQAYVYDGFSENEKYLFMTGGFNVTRGGTLADWSHMLSVGPFNLEPNDTMSVVFAVLAGENFEDLRSNAAAARGKYQEIRDLLPLTVLPPTPPTITGDVPLGQNRPNPFLPPETGYTTIDYQITAFGDSVSPTRVSLKVYDVRGRLVKVLVDAEQSPGTYSVEWDGTDDRRSFLPSGVYLYRLEQDRVLVTRKLVLIH